MAYDIVINRRVDCSSSSIHTTTNGTINKIMHKCELQAGEIFDRGIYDLWFFLPQSLSVRDDAGRREAKSM